MKHLSGAVLLLCFFFLAVVQLSAKEDTEYLDGVLLSLEQTKVGNKLMGGHQEFTWKIQVGESTYYGFSAKAGLRGYKPKMEDWPANTPVKVRFKRKGMAGPRRLIMYVLRSDGKEVETEVWSILDKNGVEKCKHPGMKLCG